MEKVSVFFSPGNISLKHENKKCPMCAESIMLKAIKCKYCGHIFDQRDVERQVNERISEIVKQNIDAGLRQCPMCNGWGVHKVRIEDGSWEEWCPHCKNSIPKIQVSPEIQEITNLEFKKANTAIKGAWIAGIVSGSITLICVIGGFLGMDSYSLVDVLLAYGLSYGIYRKSRICAMALLIYFVICKIYILIYGRGTNPLGILVGLLLTFFYAYGAYGTFLYNKLISREAIKRL
jgi:hypothetical protein